jgi:hypothetical protein
MSYSKRCHVGYCLKYIVVAGGDYTEQGNQILECVRREILQNNVQNELTNLANQEVSLKSYEWSLASLGQALGKKLPT